jgi:hypothetical protein
MDNLKAFAILGHSENAGRPTAHDELFDAVWPETSVQPEALKRHVFDIRNISPAPPEGLGCDTLPGGPNA